MRFHQGDAELIAPSLYAGRGNGNHRSADDNVDTAARPEPEATTDATDSGEQPAAPEVPDVTAAAAAAAAPATNAEAATLNGATAEPFVP